MSLLIAPTVRTSPDRLPDVVILGAGIIGLATALELSDRGAAVTVIDRGRSLTGASTAAAGMLAAEDPCNPPEFLRLSRLSADRYPAFLGRIEALCGIAVPFQTDTTIQYTTDGSKLRLAEHSIDPRQLAAALLAAVKASAIQLIEDGHVLAIGREVSDKKVHLSGGLTITAQAILYAAGAWTSEVMTRLGADPVSVEPRKGQMLRVRLPHALDEVHRSEEVYIVPRTRGPQAGTALIGATVESAGFDTSVHSDALDGLRALAAELLPAFGSKMEAPAVESWAGMRPSTPDMLPVLGACARSGEFIATGHYRNGILLAPGTALVMGDLLEGKPAVIDLSALSPLRFAAAVSA
jgi:glycine oxidase